MFYLSVIHSADTETARSRGENGRTQYGSSREAGKYPVRIAKKGQSLSSPSKLKLCGAIYFFNGGIS